MNEELMNHGKIWSTVILPELGVDDEVQAWTNAFNAKANGLDMTETPFIGITVLDSIINTGVCPRYVCQAMICMSSQVACH